MNTHISPTYPALVTSVLNTQDTACLLLDTAGVIVFANDKFAHLSSHHTTALLGTPLTTHCSANDRAALEAIFGAGCAPKDVLPTAATLILPGPDGPALSLGVTPLLGPDGAGLGFLCQAKQDLSTPSPVAEAEAEAAVSHWEVALKSAGLAVWDTGGPDAPYFISDAWFEMRGLKPSAPAEIKDWLDDVHPDDLPQVLGHKRRRDSGQTDNTTVEYRFKHPTRGWIWILSHTRVLGRDDQNRPIRVVGSESDVTQFKDVENQHHAAMRRLRLALEVAELGIWQYCHETKMVLWDDQLLRIYGIEDGQNLRPSSEWTSFIHPDDQEVAAKFAQDCISGISELILDYRIIRPDGAIRYVRSRAQRSFDETEHGLRVIGMSFDVTEDRQKTQDLEVARAAMEYDSRHDALTGLANRRCLDEYHDTMLQQAGDDIAFAVLHMDLDRFKQINDAMGHAAGDAVLCHFAMRLTEIIGDEGLPARVGGDEFVVLLPGTHTQHRLDDIVAQITSAAASPFHFEGQLCHFGISIGIARHHASGDDDTKVATYVNADLALYQAKKTGRNCSCHFEPRMRVEALARRTMADDVSKAIENNEFRCHYQPQFCAQSGKVVGFEALVRWHCPGRGLLSPGAFLPTATANGQAGEVDAWVLRNVLAHQASWAAQGFEVPAVSVNLSQERLMNPRFAQSITALDIPKGQIRFELLETTFLDEGDDHDTLSENIRFLRTAGFELEIDDFGSGHASILGFIKIAPSRLKIDRGLIAPIVASQSQREIVRAIVNIARLSNAEVVAEGIETIDHAQIATKLGCDILQGYGLARPMAEHDVRGFLTKARPAA